MTITEVPSAGRSGGGLAVHPLTPGLTDPYRFLAALRRRGPVHHDPTTGMWLILGHALAEHALRDPAFSAAGGQQHRAREDDLPVSMLTTDGDLHRRLRGPATAAYSARSVERLRPAVEGIAARRLTDAFAAGAGRADGLSDIGFPFAADVLGLFLGLPVEDRPVLGALSRPASANLDPLIRGTAAVAASSASAELTAFLTDRERTAARERRHLAGIPADADLTFAERVGILNLTVVGGFEPLAVLVASMLAFVLRRPDLVELVIDRPEAATALVDETLRLESPIPFTARLCRSGYRADGIDIPSGAMVLVMLGAANRDPTVFHTPDVFDPHRHAGRHLALGGGAHYCLGAPLVRLAAGSLLRAALDRRPIPTPAPGWQPRWRPTVIPRSLTGLPLVG